MSFWASVFSGTQCHSMCHRGLTLSPCHRIVAKKAAGRIGGGEVDGATLCAGRQHASCRPVSSTAIIESRVIDIAKNDLGSLLGSIDANSTA
jgi:hypothetical protein